MRIVERTDKEIEEIKAKFDKSNPKRFAIMDGTLCCNDFDTKEEAEKGLVNWQNEEKKGRLLEKVEEVKEGIQDNVDLLTEHEQQEVYTKLEKIRQLIEMAK